MLVTLRSIGAQLRIGHNDPALLRLRDAYLEIFDDLGSRSELIEVMEVACQVGKIARALVWDRNLRMHPEGDTHEDAAAPLLWLGELLHGSWLGSTA